MSLRHFIALIGKAKGLYSSFVFIKLCITLLSYSIAPLITKQFFDALEYPKSTAFGPWHWLAAFLVIYMLEGLAFVAFSQQRILFDFKLRYLFHSNLLHWMFQRPGAQGTPVSTGDAINRFRDDPNIINSALGFTESMWGAFIFYIMAFWVMFQISPQITAYVFIPLLLGLLVVNALKRKLESHAQQHRETTGNVAEFIGDIFQSIQAVQMANHQDNIAAQFSKLNRHRQEAAVKKVIFQESLSGLFGITTALGTSAVIVLSSVYIRENRMTIGDFSLFVVYLFYIPIFINSFGQLMLMLKQAEVSLKRLVQLIEPHDMETLIDTPPDFHSERPTPVPPKKPEPFRELKAQLSYHYPGTSQGIEQVPLHLKAGTLTVITGKVGSGKTTLLHALLGLLGDEVGTIFWNDSPVHQPSRFFVPPRCAFTPQVPRLFSDTVLQNFMLDGIDKNNDALQQALHEAVLENELASWPEHLNTRVGPNGIKLSGGQIQRVAAARMLVRQSEFLVCDDLSSALDVETERKLWDRVLKNQSRTCLVVSHRPFLLNIADQVLQLDEGKLVCPSPINQS